MAWQWTLHDAAQPGTAFFYQEVGTGFYYISIDSLETIQRLLLTASHQLRRNTIIYEEWVRFFNPFKPYRILIPTWITLRLIPLELLDMAPQIAGVVRKVLICDNTSAKSSSPRFYIGLDLAQGWVATIAVPNIQYKDALVIVEYDSIQHIRYH
jgi:hypothetical protein